MPSSHPWKSTGSKRTISWKYHPSDLVMQYLHDMRDAVRNGVLMAEEMRRRDGKIPTPINLRRELKPWFDSQFDYARHHINPVCQAAVGALKSHRKKKIKKPTPEINKLTMRMDSMLVRIFEDSIRVTIKPGIYEWIPLVKKNKRCQQYSKLKMSEFLITDRFVVVSFSDKSIKRIANGKIGLDLNFNNVTATVISEDNRYARENGVQVIYIQTSSIARIQNDYSRNRRRIQRKVRNSNKKNKMLLNLDKRMRHSLNDNMHKLSSYLVNENPKSSFVLEDLTGIKKQGDIKSKKFRSYLNSWPYYAFQKMIEYKSPNETIYVDPRGTSSECPFCGESLKHPTWKISRCRNCDRVYDRDRLASYAIALRGSDLCGDPFPVSAFASMQSVKNEYLHASLSPSEERTGLTEIVYASKDNYQKF